MLYSRNADATFIDLLYFQQSPEFLTFFKENELPPYNIRKFSINITCNLRFSPIFFVNLQPK